MQALRLNSFLIIIVYLHVCGSQLDDTKFGSFLLETLPRLVFHLDFLMRNPTVRIHYGFTKKEDLPTSVIPHTFLSWLGLSDRLVNGSVFAREALLPREGGCQDATYNAWEIVTMRETLLQLSLTSMYEGIDTSRGYLQKLDLWKGIDPMYPDGQVPHLASFDTPVVLIIERFKHSRYANNDMDKGARIWPKGAVREMKRALARLMPHHHVQIFSDVNEKLMSCPPCQMRLFYRAEVVIGMYGAGLANCIFMKRGGVLVEVLPEDYFDSRHGPITGIFPGLSSTIGLHHFSYMIGEPELDPQHLAQETALYYQNVTRWSRE